MSNGAPGSQFDTSLHGDMAAFDSLPRPLRRVLSEGAFNFSAELIAESLAEDPFAVWTFERRIREIDADQLVEQAIKDYGPDHPQARP